MLEDEFNSGNGVVDGRNRDQAGNLWAEAVEKSHPSNTEGWATRLSARSVKRLLPPSRVVRLGSEWNIDAAILATTNCFAQNPRSGE